MRRKSPKEVLFDVENHIEATDKAAEQLIALVEGDYGDFSGSIRDGKVQGLKVTKSNKVQNR